MEQTPRGLKPGGLSSVRTLVRDLWSAPCRLRKISPSLLSGSDVVTGSLSGALIACAEVPRADCMQRLSCEEWRRRRRCDPTVDSFDGLIDVYRMREVFPVSSVRGERIGHFGMVGSTTFGDFARAVAWGVLTRCAIIGWGMNEVGFSHRRVLKPCA